MLTILDRNWGEVFGVRLDKQARNYVYLARDTRNSVAHHKGGDIETNDAIFALEGMTRLLEAVGSSRAKEIQAICKGVGAAPAPVPPPPAAVPVTNPAPVAEKAKPKAAQSALPLTARPWREVVLPHRDVQEGRLLEAEFVVNLADVLAGKAEFGYQEPVGFFERTYLTSGLRELLTVAVRRLGGVGGEPVAQLKTAFGGGKTHTMLALYHLARAGALGANLPGMADIFASAGVKPEDIAGTRVAVLVGTALDATRPHLDATGYGVTVRTLWGELAAQLGGAEGYALVETADKTGRAPGSDTLVELIDRAGPTLILIDELVAFARNLLGRDDLPGGTFDAVLTFVQALTEAAKRSRRCLVVASIPESKVEMGDETGQRAHAALEHTFGRMEAIWKPVAPAEGFEIVRRRLFAEVTEPDAKEAVCREFAPAPSATALFEPILRRIRSGYVRSAEGDAKLLRKHAATAQAAAVLSSVEHRLGAYHHHSLSEAERTTELTAIGALLDLLRPRSDLVDQPVANKSGMPRGSVFQLLSPIPVKVEKDVLYLTTQDAVYALRVSGSQD